MLAPCLSSDGEVPVEETSDASPFAELIQRARDAMASGSQEDQVAACLDIYPVHSEPLQACPGRRHRQATCVKAPTSYVTWPDNLP